jgi:(p)ppGpp synthase/HD superfamily hydrolase
VKVEHVLHPGLLADVSQILSESGFSIKSYTGHTTRGYGMMLFGLEAEVNNQTNVDRMVSRMHTP